MELQKLIAERERKDSRSLERFSRKVGQHANLRPWQRFGVLLVLSGILFGFVGFASKELAIVVVPCSLAAIVVGVISFRVGKYRDRIELTLPSYEKLVHPPQARPAKEKIQELEDEIATELAKRFDQERKSKRAMLLAKESYAALEDCDYLRAYVAGRACLKVDKKSVEGALALAVACASYGQIQNMAKLLAFVQKHTGFKTFSTAWGAAWAALLAGDLVRAEAMLERALKLQPQKTTLLSLLAIAQSRRGKLQSSIMNARQACEADPASRGKTKFLIARLLDGGFTHEAQEKVERVQSDLDTDLELMFSMSQLHLLKRNYTEADQWTARIKQSGVSAQLLVRLGKLYETARLKDQATTLYQEALSVDHFPEAHLGLGRLEVERNNKTAARKHILAALNVDRPVGKEGVTTWQMLTPILTQMLGLHDPVLNCRAWIASFPSDGQPVNLAGQRFMVYASDLSQAQEYFQTMLNAFQPEKPPLIMPQSNWSVAPRPLQPDGPVRPGVQGIWK
jgi:tetratricopeptide (TPR) repeat protein